ncbi:MAG TPA: GGDEF domain-containing protein [Candidatus Butyricicoccus avistercoris]|uniref:GGDEF domain-containing protein n=1 Tax=Candidatus Butyricicoccus avistercoris TaxID=2838518 RepID=A0A9D1PGU6_9FIRM|nr:GGDEF domain-containing protein [Candidatus Butyricicoccus avistercoris]
MIEKMWEVYENLNEIVYVSDADTYDLIYMNRKAREIFGNISIDELKKRKCYSLLQGCNSPCEMCTNDRIKVGEFYEWTYYNPVIDTKFALKDTIFIENNRRCRMEIAIDMTTQEHQKQLIESFVNNEIIINEGIKMALAEETPDKSIMVLLEYLGKAFKGERAYIFEETSPKFVANTYEWCANGVSVQIESLENIPEKELEDWYIQFRQNKSVIIENLEDIKEISPDVYNILKPQDIVSLVVCPLVYQKKIIGFYGIDNPPVSNLKYIMTMLNVMASFIVSIINRRELFNKLVNISYYDRLTGAGNRYAMERAISDVDLTKSIGIIYGDVMELKSVNDTQGHLEGDKLLLGSYDHLCRYFDKKDIFRIGGDEFVVICSSITLEDFKQRISSIKNDMEHSNAKIALGQIWKQVCDEKIENLIVQADQLMYEEKRRYYNEKRSKCNKHDDLRREIPLVGVHEYFMQQHSFHSEAFFKAIMQSSFGLSAFVGDLQGNIYYLSDNLRDILKTKSNMVCGLIETWSVVLSDDKRNEFLNKWQYLLENKQKHLEFAYDVDVDGIRRVGVLKIDVRWNGEIPLFCTGIFIH